MESRSYNFSSGKQRSSQVASTAVVFSREEESAPRTQIIKKECPEEYKAYKACFNEHGDQKCQHLKDEMKACGQIAFRMVNTTPSYAW